MDNFIFFNMMILIVIICLLMAFAVFAIGFVIGFWKEERKIFKRKTGYDNNKYEESEKERKAKKEWKKFLEYDGSAPDGVDG